MPNPLFSVVIPALNEEKYIKNILSNLAKQTLKDFEVLVVDARSTDKTVNLALEFKEKLSLTIITSDTKNLSFQRNLGAKNSKGEYIFFIDADNTIPNNFLSLASKNLEEKYADALIPILYPEKKGVFNKIIYPFSTTLIKLFLLTPRPFSTGGNVIIRNDFFKKTHGFDTEIFVGEDHDIIRQVKELGGKIRLMTNTYVILSGRRFEQEGFSTYLKYTYAFFYQIFARRVEKQIYHYKMGGDNYK